MIDVSPLCNTVMRKVAASGAIVSDRSDRDNTDRACAWMREEVKAFFFAERYATSRGCVMSSSLPDNMTISLIAANAVAGIVSGKWPVKEG
jgi:hypothetical protein